MSDGRVTLVAGSTGSGKTLWVREQAASAPRLLVWDALGEWNRELRIKSVSLRELSGLIRDELRDGAGGKFRASFTGPITRENFCAFCGLAWVWLRIVPGVLVVEELADVTSPGKAPAAWGDIVRKGRHFGADIFAITQRPAESDKTALGNAAAVHCGLLAFPSDRRYLANVLDVTEPQLAALKPRDWIERDMRTRALSRGTVKIPRKT
jgi:DNA helicase HerA-like ATPase